MHQRPIEIHSLPDERLGLTRLSSGGHGCPHIVERGRYRGLVGAQFDGAAELPQSAAVVRLPEVDATHGLGHGDVVRGLPQCDGFLPGGLFKPTGLEQLHHDLYVTGGGGLYHPMQDFTQPSVAVVPAFNPFFGFGAVAIPTTQVISSYSINKPGIDAGVGIAFGSKWHGKFFAEARYNRIIAKYHTDYLPVTFGFRW